jgi:hypothetical protein
LKSFNTGIRKECLYRAAELLGQLDVPIRHVGVPSISLSSTKIELDVGQNASLQVNKPADLGNLQPVYLTGSAVTAFNLPDHLAFTSVPTQEVLATLQQFGYMHMVAFNMSMSAYLQYGFKASREELLNMIKQMCGPISCRTSVQIQFTYEVAKFLAKQFWRALVCLGCTRCWRSFHEWSICLDLDRTASLIGSLMSGNSARRSHPNLVCFDVLGQRTKGGGIYQAL